jgi:hypothetical protein
MASLAKCLDLIEVHEVEAKKLIAEAKGYKKKGFTEKEANEKVVRNAIAALESEQGSVIEQIEKQIGTIKPQPSKAAEATPSEAAGATISKEGIGKVGGKPAAEAKSSETIEKSIEKGISLKRAEELVGKKNPSAKQIRGSFEKMTDIEQEQVLSNVESEIKEIEVNKKSYFKSRRAAFVPDKPIYTEKINAANKLLKGKKQTLERLRGKKAEKQPGKIEGKKEQYSTKEMPFKIKPPKKLYRGTAHGKKGSGIYSMGKGLYSSPDKAFAKKYGMVEELDPKKSFPKNPLVLRNVAGGAPSALTDWILQNSNFRNIREFNKEYPDPGKFVREHGYDGIVAGDEVVKYTEESKVYSTTGKPSLKNLTFEDIQSLPFTKKGTVLRNDDGTFSVSFPGNKGFFVENVESILPDQVAFKASYGREKRKKGEKVAGSYTHTNKTVKIVKGIGDKWTIAHEFQHFLEKSNLLTPKEIAALERQSRAFNGDKYYGEEGRARFVEHELEARSKKRTSIIGKTIQKIQDIIDGFVNLFTKTTGGVIRDIESGKVAVRKGKPYTYTNEAEAYSGTVPWAYSQLLNVVEANLKAMPKKAQSVMGWLEKKQVKPAELKWMGVEQWISENQKDGTIDKEAFLEFVKANQIEIREVEKHVDNFRHTLTQAERERFHVLLNLPSGEWSDEASGYVNGRERTAAEEDEFQDLLTRHKADVKYSRISKVQYESYQEPGGKDYRELVFTLPTNLSDDRATARELGAKASKIYDEYGLESPEYKAIVAEQAAVGKRLADRQGRTYQSSH